MWKKSEFNVQGGHTACQKSVPCNDGKNRNEIRRTDMSPLPVKRSSIYGINKEKGVGGRKWRESLCSLLDQYGQRTTVHGLNRICRMRTGFKERIIWTFGFLVALYLLTGMYALFSRRYRRKQFQTIVNDTFYPIYKVQFPEVVICAGNRLNWQRLNDAKEQFLAPEHRTIKHERLFSDIVARYGNLTVNTMFSLQGLPVESLHELNYINFTNVVDMMSWRCEEILRDCKWRFKSLNCCDIFFPRRTSLGQCLAFNSVLSDGGKMKTATDPYWPWHYSHEGQGSGLQLRVLLTDAGVKSNRKRDDQVLFMTIDRYVYSDILFTSVKANHSAHVSIWGSISYMEELARSTSWGKRGCVFEGEMKSLTSLPGLPYQFENCFYECQQQGMLQSCNCSSDLFFPIGAYPVCQLIDTPCLAEKWDNFDYSEATSEEESFSGYNRSKSSCHCYFSCHSLLLENYVRLEQISPKVFEKENGSFVELDFFWLRDYLITYKTTLVFSWLDLLVSFGGIASLLLGCSLISVVELIMFLLLETPEYVWKKRRSDKRLKTLQQKNSIQNLIHYDSTH